MGSNPGRAIPKALKMVPVAALPGAQYYKASSGFPFQISHNLHRNTYKTKVRKKEKSENNQCLYSSEDRMEDWQSC